MKLLRRLFPHAPPSIEIELTAQLLGSIEAIRIVGIVAGAIGLQAALNRDLVPTSFLLSVSLVAMVRVIALRRL